MISEVMGYVDMAVRHHSMDNAEDCEKGVVDAVSSDMSESWPQTEGFWTNYLTKAHFRKIVSGIRVRDHGDSRVHPEVLIQDLCDVGTFSAMDVSKACQGTLVMKFYSRPEDRGLETRLKAFERVKREKPEASRGLGE